MANWTTTRSWILVGLLSGGMLLGPACGGDEFTGGGGGLPGGTGASAAGGGGASSSGGNGSGGEVNVPSDPLFETDIVPIFEGSCGSGNSNCHFRNAYGADSQQDCRGWLSLENAALGSVFYDGPDEGQATGCPDTALYERLMSMVAWSCDYTYVVPCDPDASYIIRKSDSNLDYCDSAPNGDPLDPMPPEETMASGELAIMRKWIENGAPRVDGSRYDCGTGGSGTGQDPEAQINHPSDGETRPSGMPIPFIGVASDPQDGTLSGSSLDWSSDVDGPIGTGTDFSFTLSDGPHVVTLTATDSDSNSASDSISLMVQ